MKTGKINLASLKHVELEMDGQSGKVKGMFIPYEVNHVFVSEKGARNIDFVAFDLKAPAKDKDGKIFSTHIIKQSYPKDVFNAMSKEEKEAMPILANLNFNDVSGTPGESTTVNQAPNEVFTPKDKLPF